MINVDTLLIKSRNIKERPPVATSTNALLPLPWINAVAIMGHPSLTCWFRSLLWSLRECSPRNIKYLKLGSCIKIFTSSSSKQSWLLLRHHESQLGWKKLPRIDWLYLHPSTESHYPWPPLHWLLPEEDHPLPSVSLLLLLLSRANEGPNPASSESSQGSTGLVGWLGPGYVKVDPYETQLLEWTTGSWLGRA